MQQQNADAVFAGSIPLLYERYLVPMIFAPYAADLAARVAARQPQRVLEIAAGTGVVTRALAKALPKNVDIVATDLNQPMLDQAASIGTVRPVQWRQADAMQLPFTDASFDVVACQFGAMFFPDKPKAFAETRRALNPGGCFLFNVWDSTRDNDFAEVIGHSLAVAFPDDPPTFLERVPHGYYDHAAIAKHLAQAGFEKTPQFFTISERSRIESARAAAIAYCQGTPVRNEIEKRDAARLTEVTDIATAALEKKFGSGAIEGKIQAHVVLVER